MDATAFNILGKVQSAEQALRNALAKSPKDPILLLNLAELLAQNDRQREAIPLLQQVVAQPHPPANAWKRLGYVLLWSESKTGLEEACQASLEYLKSRPDDWGAKLNLACAYAQLYSLNVQGMDTKALEILEQIVPGKPHIRNRVRQLQDDDFKSIKNNSRFQVLIDGDGEQIRGTPSGGTSLDSGDDGVTESGSGSGGSGELPPAAPVF